MATRRIKNSDELVGTAYGLLFAVENYLDPDLSRVLYAERDATEVANALSSIGYDPLNIALCVNEKATHKNMEYEVKTLARTAKKGDVVFFFFAGHGYTWNGHNQLMAYDTRIGDIPGTAVPLKSLFDLFEKSECQQVMFFLDCCHSGMKLADDERGVLELMSREELKSYFENSKFRVVFSSCDKDEFSYPSAQYKHGHWTYHLLRALRGEEPHLLDKEGRLRSTSLQDHLRVEVPKNIAMQRTDNRTQRPTMYGDVSGTFAIAQLGPMLAKAKAEIKLKTIGLKNSTLRSIDVGSVSGLSGFNKAKGHSVPKYPSASTRSWVSALAADDLKSEMDVFFKVIRKTRLYSNNDIKYDPPKGGSASIRTPDFEFSITYSQSEDDPGEYVVARELVRLNNPALIEAEWFNNLFDGVFDQAVFEFTACLNVNTFINSVEDIDFFELDFDPERTECRITMDNFNGEIIITSISITYEFQSASTPQAMALEFKKAHQLLMALPSMRKALPR